MRIRIEDEMTIWLIWVWLRLVEMDFPF